MANCNVERLQRPYTCRAFGEVAVEVHKYLHTPVEANPAGLQSFRK